MQQRHLDAITRFAAALQSLERIVQRLQSLAIT